MKLEIIGDRADVQGQSAETSRKHLKMHRVQFGSADAALLSDADEETPARHVCVQMPCGHEAAAAWQGLPSEELVLTGTSRAL